MTTPSKKPAPPPAVRSTSTIPTGTPAPNPEAATSTIAPVAKHSSAQTTLPRPPNTNIIKTRDDKEPVYFTVGVDDKCTISSEPYPSWAPTKEGFERKILRQRIEPWLTALFQSEHLSLLVGSGLTHAVHYLAAGRGAADMANPKFTTCGEKIAAAALASATKAGRSLVNLEDALRVANELLRGLEITNATVEKDALGKELEEKLSAFAQSMLQSERGIATAPSDKRENAFNTLVNFLMSFASRTGTRDRLSIFTTNYERLLETGAEIAGLHLVDRFVGTISPIFRSSRLDIDLHYNPPGIRGEPRYLEGVARFSKLHGSIDWVQAGNDIKRIGLPFGVEDISPFLSAPGFDNATAHKLMIYPNAAKDRETAMYPYVELFRDFAAAVCRPNGVLVTYGYSFGDEHINRIIEDMLTIPSTHLVVIAYSDPLGRIMSTYKKIGRAPQISLIIGNELGDLSKLTENYLPKSAIDRATFRMSELLKMRFGTEKQTDDTKDTSIGSEKSSEPKNIDLSLL